MLKRLNLNKTIKYFSLVLLMLMSVLLINIPKTYALDSPVFMPYETDPQKGKVAMIDDANQRIIIQITEGTAIDGGDLGGAYRFNFDSTYTEFYVIEDWKVGELLEYRTDTRKFVRWIPNWDDYKNTGHTGTVTNIYTADGSGYEMARIYVGGINLSFNFRLDTLPQDTQINDTLVWNVGSQSWNTPDKVPVLDGETAFVTNIDNLISIDDILSRIEAIDAEDGNITHLIQIDSANSTYNSNISTLGTYMLKLYVIDSANNRADLTVHVLVKDIAEPVIIGTKTYTQSYTSKKDVGTILAALSATDNYDPSVTVKVKTDNYTANYNKVGSYEIIFNATDTSGNEALYTVTVNVVDDVKPVFTGPNTIVKGQTETLLLADILSQVSVNDAVDKNVSFIVKNDAYTGNGNKVGDWTILLEATDSSGNTATHTITIQVKDNIPPVFYVDNFFIHVDDIVTLTRQDIIDLLTATGQIQVNATTTFSFPLNEYEGNESTPGIYGLMVQTTSVDGTTKQVSLAIQVNETDEDPGNIIVEPKKGFFESIWSGIKSVWNWLTEPINENSNFRKGYYIIIGIAIIGLLGTFSGKSKSRFRFKRFKKRRYRR